MNASVAIQVLPTVSSDQLLPVVDKVIEYIKSKGLKTFVSPFETTIEGITTSSWRLSSSASSSPCRPVRPPR